MSISPTLIYNIVQIYKRVSNLSLSEKKETEEEVDRRDIVNISSEAKRRHLLEETKKEVLQKIKDTEKLRI